MIKIEDFFKILGYDEVVNFGKAQRNRKVTDKHVNDFVNLIKDKEYSEEDCLIYGIIPVIYNPIFNHILDGQNRVEAFIKSVERGLIDSRFKILVGYWNIYDEDYEKEIIIKLNSNSKNWSLNDYIDSYAKDNDYYNKLKAFCETHSLCNMKKDNGDIIKINYRYGAAIIKGTGQSRNLRREEFSATDEEIEIAHTIHEEMVQIRQKLGINYTSTDIEAMAEEWRIQRDFISKNDIMKLSNLPKKVREMKPRNKSDWNTMFAWLKDAKAKKDRRSMLAAPAYAI